MPVWELEQYVVNSQVVFFTENKKQISICIAVANTMVTKNALPCTVITDNSGLEVVKNHKFI